MHTAPMSPDVTAKLDFYVYRLVLAGQTFYVGKGVGDRVHAHRGNPRFPPQYEERIVQWGLSEDEALRLEAALIAVLQPSGNRVSGHGHVNVDVPTDAVQARLGAATFDVTGIPDGIVI